MLGFRVLGIIGFAVLEFLCVCSGLLMPSSCLLALMQQTTIPDLPGLKIVTTLRLLNKIIVECIPQSASLIIKYFWLL